MWSCQQNPNEYSNSSSSLGFSGYLLCLKAAIAVTEQAQKPLVIFAAASLKDALEEVLALHAAAYEGPPVLISLASSGALARQIQFGAPADLIISAKRAWVSLLEKEGLIKRARPAFLNQLVVASSVEPEQNIEFTRRETFKAALAVAIWRWGMWAPYPRASTPIRR